MFWQFISPSIDSIKNPVVFTGPFTIYYHATYILRQCIGYINRKFPCFCLLIIFLLSNREKAYFIFPVTYNFPVLE